MTDAMNAILKVYSAGKLEFDEYKKAEEEKKAREED